MTFSAIRFSEAGQQQTGGHWKANNTQFLHVLTVFAHKAAHGWQVVIDDIVGLARSFAFPARQDHGLSAVLDVGKGKKVPVAAKLQKYVANDGSDPARYPRLTASV